MMEDLNKKLIKFEKMVQGALVIWLASKGLLSLKLIGGPEDGGRRTISDKEAMRGTKFSMFAGSPLIALSSSSDGVQCIPNNKLFRNIRGRYITDEGWDGDKRIVELYWKYWDKGE